MKRSEMVKILKDSISRHLDFDNGFFFNEASDILHDLEEAGMLPPFHSTKGYEAAESHGTGTLTYYRKQFNEWDEE